MPIADPTARLGMLAHAYSEHAFASGGIAIWLTDKDSERGDLRLLRFTAHEPLDPTMVLPAPTMVLYREIAQRLFDTLWDKGFRPSDRFAVGAGAAQTEHIHDLRKILFRLLDASHPAETPTAGRSLGG